MIPINLWTFLPQRNDYPKAPTSCYTDALAGPDFLQLKQFPVYFAVPASFILHYICKTGTYCYICYFFVKLYLEILLIQAVNVAGGVAIMCVHF